jgi:hypothetical protein
VPAGGPSDLDEVVETLTALRRRFADVESLLENG